MLVVVDRENVLTTPVYPLSLCLSLEDELHNYVSDHETELS